jgi:hypothetical protein
MAPDAIYNRLRLKYSIILGKFNLTIAFTITIYVTLKVMSIMGYTYNSLRS